MGSNNRRMWLDNNTDDELVRCLSCNEDYIQWTEEQVLGCKSKDYDTCPYCGAVKQTSMKIEFHNRKRNL